MTTATAESAYISHYNRAMAALKNIETMIHDLPAPEGENQIIWANVGDMNRIADALEELVK